MYHILLIHVYGVVDTLYKLSQSTKKNLFRTFATTCKISHVDKMKSALAGHIRILKYFSFYDKISIGKIGKKCLSACKSISYVRVLCLFVHHCEATVIMSFCVAFLALK